MPPAKPEDLAAAESGGDHGEEHNARLLAPGPLLSLRLVDELGERSLNAADLDRGQDRPTPTRLAWSVDGAGRVRTDERAPLRRLEQRVQEVQVPVHGARRESGALLPGDVPLELLDVDCGQPEGAEHRDQVAFDD